MVVGALSVECVKLHLRDGRTSVCHESQRRRHGVTAAIAVDVVIGQTRTATS